MNVAVALVKHSTSAIKTEAFNTSNGATKRWMKAGTLIAYNFSRPTMVT